MKTPPIILLTLTLLLLPAVALAHPAGSGQAQEPVACELDYTVQVGDWLSKLAEKYYGNVFTYPAIVAATNAQTDEAYATIENPDLIEPGWTLCIPSAEDAATLMASSAMPGPQPEGEAAAGLSQQDLADTAWILTALNGAEPLPDTTITAAFGEDGMVNGTNGCNRYGAAYEADGNNITITRGPTTLMACPDPVTLQADEYMAALASAATYQIDGDTLTLSDADGNVAATFSAQPTGLAGTSWDVIAYNNGREAVVSVIIGTEITAAFGEDGNLTGNAGCNDYSVPYEADDDGNISIGPAVTTFKECSEPEGIMQQEQEYLAALETAATYRAEGDTMEMRTAEGSRVASFKLAP
jgi:heat shock protein HslJ